MALKLLQSNPEDKLDTLQRRYQLLQGERKLSVEKASVEMVANKEMIKTLSEANNRIRKEIAQAAGVVGNQKEFEKALKAKTKYNQVKAENDRKIKRLSELQVRLAAEERKQNTPATEESRQTRVLENRIDKAMIKFNDAMTIKNTYEGIHKRLSEERIGSDNVLKDLEGQIQQKKREAEELLSHCHESKHAKELAQAELHRFEQCVMEERNQMDAVVAEKKQIVQQRIEMNQRLEEKERRLKGAGGVGVFAKKAVLLGESHPPPTTPARSSESKDQQRLAEYELAYTKLKEVTGVSARVPEVSSDSHTTLIREVNEIIQKFLAQEVTHTTLVRETEEQQRKLDAANADFEKSKKQLEELRFSGTAPVGARNRQAIEDVERHVAESAGRLEKNKQRYEQLARIMIDVNAGIGHLHAKLAVVQLDDRLRPVVTSLSNDTVEEILSQCELKLLKVLASVKPFEEPPNSPREYRPDVRIKLNSSREAELDLDLDKKESNVFDRQAMKASADSFLEKKKKQLVKV